MGNLPVEIVLKKDVILSEAEKLKQIAKDVTQRKLSLLITNSEGKTVNSINKLIMELNNLGCVLGAYLEENVENVRLIAEKFTEKDRQIAINLKG